MTGSLGVLNAGSSSIKFALYDEAPPRALMFRGMVERIPRAPRLAVSDASGRQVACRAWTTGQLDHHGATVEILNVARELADSSPVRAVGHRIVHGGTKYSSPIRLDPQVLAFLESLVPLAPLHQPHNLAPVKVIAEAAPHLPQVACFDTAFHRSQPHLAQAFALPRELSDAGVRRYGFHGLSYEFIARRFQETQPELASKRLIVAHLGNGASLCAIDNGKSVASTMGFTAVDGLMMGTRCGALDPGVILYLMSERGMDARAIEELIYGKSGLLGVSGISSDMRALRQSAEPNAREAIALFVYRICREVGSMAAALGGLDALIFTGGIGENDAATRAEVLTGCRWLGLELEPDANARGSGRISAQNSSASAWVVATDEERMIAEHTASLLQA
jgi:acetate kinase